jgi:hypothetical protein
MAPAAEMPPGPRRFIRAMCIFVVISSFAVTACQCCQMSNVPKLSFLIRIIVIGAIIYVLMFFFFENGGRLISETFLISLGVIAVTYFLIKSPLWWFAWSLALCVLFSATFSL